MKTSKNVIGCYHFCLAIISGFANGVGAAALFNVIVSLIQLSGKYIVADRENSCLRDISFESAEQDWKTSTFAGACQKPDDRDGRRQNARFNKMEGMLQQGNNIYITDTHNKKIKQLNLNNNIVITIHESVSYPLFSLEFGTNINEFYVTAPHGILHIRERQETWLVGGKTSSTIDAGQFSSVGFAAPRSIAKITDNILVVVDTVGATIKVIDLVLQEVRTICSGKRRNSS